MRPSRHRRRLWRAFGFLGAVALAVFGVGLYVDNPDVPSYYASGWLTLPFLVVASWWLHNHLPLVLQSVAAAVLAVTGVVGYLVWPDAAWWAFGQVALGPAIFLVAK